MLYLKQLKTNIKMNNLQQIATHLKELGIDEIKKLAAILEADIETELGLTVNGTAVTALDVSGDPEPVQPPTGPKP